MGKDAMQHFARRPPWCGRGALLFSLIAAVLLAACQSASPPPAPSAPRPPQAGQAMNPLDTAAHIAGARIAAVRGDNAAATQHITDLSKDFLRSARMADPARPIDHELARATVRPLAGVRSAVWMDAANLIVMVDGARYRSAAMIDAVCMALNPLGDTLAVTVNVQDVMATTTDGAMTLSRNCQLPEGQQALFQRKRQVDVVPPELRAAFKAQQNTHQ